MDSPANKLAMLCLASPKFCAKSMLPLGFAAALARSTWRTSWLSMPAMLLVPAVFRDGNSMEPCPCTDFALACNTKLFSSLHTCAKVLLPGIWGKSIDLICEPAFAKASFQNWFSVCKALVIAELFGASEKKIPPKPLEVLAKLCANQACSSCKSPAIWLAPCAGAGNTIWVALLAGALLEVAALPVFAPSVLSNTSLDLLLAPAVLALAAGFAANCSAISAALPLTSTCEELFACASSEGFFCASFWESFCADSALASLLLASAVFLLPDFFAPLDSSFDLLAVAA